MNTQTIRGGKLPPHGLTRTSTPADKPAAKSAAPAPTLPPLINWNSKIISRPTAVYTPTTEAEIVSIMKTEKAVRVGGAFHSFNGALSAEGVAFINMVNFNEIAKPVKHPDGSWTVRVQAGATLREISTALHKHGLALENLPMAEKITIGGAVATGAHGSGLTTRATVAEQVVGMEIITSSGEKKIVSADELPLYRIHLGLLGVVTTLELRVIPDIDLMHKEDVINGEDAVVAALAPERLRKDVSSFRSVMYAVDPHLTDPSKTRLLRWGLVEVTDANREEAAKLPRKQVYEVRPRATDFGVYKAFEAASQLAGEAASKMKAAIRQRFVPHDPQMVGRSALMYQNFLDQPVHDLSYGVPLEKAQEAYKRVIAMMRELGHESTIPLAMRFLRGTNETVLGMNSGRDVVVFELLESIFFDDPKTGVPRADVKRALDAFEVIMKDLGARPHWGKEFYINPQDRHDPRAWQRFGKEVAKVGQKLVNPWTKAMTPAGVA